MTSLYFRLANKQDLHGAMDELDVCQQLNLEEVVNLNKCPCRVVSTSMLSEQTSLIQALSMCLKCSVEAEKDSTTVYLICHQASLHTNLLPVIMSSCLGMLVWSADQNGGFALQAGVVGLVCSPL